MCSGQGGVRWHGARAPWAWHCPLLVRAGHVRVTGPKPTAGSGTGKNEEHVAGV